jgi:hypothetical protein
MVNCTAEFTDQPKVINGFSDFMVEVFGEKGNMQICCWYECIAKKYSGRN